MAGISDFLFGQPAQKLQFQKFTQPQQNLQNQSINQVLGLLQNPRQGFQPYEQYARQQFQQKTVPSIAERFTALSPSAQRSSAFQSSLGQAGSDLESQLAMLGGQYGQQQLNSLFPYALQPSFEELYMPQGGGFLQGLAPGIGQAVGGVGSIYGLMKLLKFLGG